MIWKENVKMILNKKNAKKRNVGLINILPIILLVLFSMTGCSKIPDELNKFDYLDAKKLSLPKVKQASTIYAVDGSKLADLYVENRKYATLKEIPKNLRLAFIAIEDERFYQHHGVDARGIGRAFIQSIKARRLAQGASTITMQLARNIFLTNRKTFSRKINESLIAIQLEKNLSKEQILELYLNQIYFGHGAYGVKEAAETYFVKDLRDLTLSECAVMAAAIKAPAIYSPFIDPGNSLKRRNIILAKMRSLNIIDEAAYAHALREPLRLAAKPEGAGGKRAPYFVAWVLHQLTDTDGEFKYTHQQLYTEGYKIYTTLDPQMQTDAEAAVRGGVAAANLYLKPDITKSDDQALDFALKNDVRLLSASTQSDFMLYLNGMADNYADNCGPDEAADPLCIRISETFLALTGSSKPRSNYRAGELAISPDVFIRARRHAMTNPFVSQGALIALDVHSGNILAMVGGTDFRKSEFNRTWQAKRQPGSSFKPFVYLTALENGDSMSATVVNGKYCIGNYCPQNYGGGYGDSATVTYNEAIVHSLNIPAVRVGQKTGLDKIADMCRQLGIKSYIPVTNSMPLGTASLSPMEMASAYSVIADNGRKRPPVGITAIKDSTGKTIYSHNYGRQDERLLSSNTVREITTAMSQVLTRGTATRAYFGRPTAGKTGTTTNFRDAWFVGFSPDISTAVWIGNDDTKPLCSNRKCTGHNITGGTVPAPIWRDFMKSASLSMGFSNFVFDEEAEPEVSTNEKPLSATQPISGTEPEDTTKAIQVSPSDESMH